MGEGRGYSWGIRRNGELQRVRVDMHSAVSATCLLCAPEWGGALPAATAGDEVTRAPQPTEPQALYVKLGPSRATILYVTAPEGEFELHEVVGEFPPPFVERRAASPPPYDDEPGAST